MYPVINLNFPIPDGYSLREDEDFVYLYYGDEGIASFVKSISIEIIQSIIEAHKTFGYRPN